MSNALPQFDLTDYQDGIEVPIGSPVVYDPQSAKGEVIPWKPGDPGRPFGEVVDAFPGGCSIRRFEPSWP